MPQVEINGKTVSVEKGSNLIEAAQKVGTYIPHFCYHKKLSIAANCRMCLIEVEKVPKPVPACATLVGEGMKIFTESKLAKKAREGVMEFLLINHPLDCPVCDQGGECQLQDLSVGYGKGYSRYDEPKRTFPAKYMGPLVAAEEMSRCIHCTRCIRFTEEIAGYQEIGMINRGDHSEIITFIDKVVQSEVSGNVIDVCPVGALTSRPFRFSARSWELSRRKSISPHDSLGSNIIVQTKNRQVKRVLPLENEDINECWLSDRDRFSYEGLYHQERLKNPKIKYDNQWHDVDWETAFKYVIKGLTGVSSMHGKDKVGIVTNPANTLEELYLIKKFAQKFGIDFLDSRLKMLDYRLDKAKNGVFWLGQTIKSLTKNDAILFVGTNLRAEQPLLITRIRRAAKNGTKVSTINFVNEELNMPLLKQVLVKPSDILSELQNLVGNSKPDNHLDLAKIKDSLKEAEISSIILGGEVLNHPDFTNIYLLLQEICRETNSVLGIIPQYANSLAADLLQIIPKNSQEGINHLHSDSKKALMLFNVEPDIDVINPKLFLETLEKAETVISFTTYESQTLLKYADVLLPVSPFTETSGTLINLEGKKQSFYASVQPWAESRPLWKILRVLGNFCELDGFDYLTSEDVLNEVLHNHNLEMSLNNGVGPIDSHELAKVSQGKDELWRVGGTSIYATDSIVRRSVPLQKTKQAKVPEALIHPDTLKELDLSEKEKILLQNTVGESLNVTLKASQSVSPGSVYLPVHQDNKLLGGMLDKVKLSRG